jgi:hypothetical protein
MTKSCPIARSIPRLSLALALAVVVNTGSAAAQDALAQAKTLYAAAAYDESLLALGADVTPEAQQYRALCLLALGRTPDAERVIESLITAAPAFVVSDEDVPPRFAALFSRLRQAVLPAIVRRSFTEARDEFQAKNVERAKTLFERVVTLSVDPILATSSEAADLHLLATGFLDLMKAGAPPPPAAQAPPRAAPAQTQAAALPTPAPRVESVIPPVPIRQVVPPWPATIRTAATEIKGAVKILIGKDGRVKAAEIATSLEPGYDLDLLEAASLWRYRPATLRGEPVEVENLVVVQVMTGARQE